MVVSPGQYEGGRGCRGPPQAHQVGDRLAGA